MTLSQDITKRQINEDILAYYKRLKDLITDGVSDINDQQLYELLFNRTASYDHSSKSRRTLDLLLEANSSVENVSSDENYDNEIIKAIEQKKQELQKERNKLQAIQIHKNRNDRQDSRFELFYENIRDAIETLPLPKFEPITYRDIGDKEYVVAISDIHYGANFKAENNIYSRELCKSRFAILLQELKWLKKEKDISKLKILNIGDTIQGILRIHDLQLNDIPVVDCVVEIARIIAKFLNELSADFEIDYYHVSAANHTQTRNLGSKASELATEDMERIIVQYIDDVLEENDRVNVIYDLNKDYLILDIFDYKAIAVHGHQIKNIKTVVKDYSNMLREFFLYAFLGHRHTSNEFTVGEDGRRNIEVLNCPSFIGSCPYADKLLVGSKAAVKVYTFDSEYGHIESRNIILN